MHYFANPRIFEFWNHPGRFREGTQPTHRHVDCTPQAISGIGVVQSDEIQGRLKLPNRWT